MELIYKQEAYNIIGAAMDAHKELGCGFLESVYQEALEIELSKRNIPYEREKRLKIEYKGHHLSKQFVADFVCYDKIIIELKALSSITNDHYAQVLNYIKVTNTQLGLIINFGAKSLEYKRVIKSANSTNI